MLWIIGTMRRLKFWKIMVSGDLGRREYKKKKTHPPGYDSYLKDGSETSISTEALRSIGIPIQHVELMGDMPL